MYRSIVTCLALSVAGLAACSNRDAPTAPAVPSFSNLPCSATGTLSLSSAQAARVDCSNGGTTVTLAGNGASYLVVAQFAADLVPDVFVPYHLSSGVAIAASRSPLPSGVAASLRVFSGASASQAGTLPPMRPRAKQLTFERTLRARARQKVASGAWRPAASLSRASVARSVSAIAPAPPTVGSTRAFRVLANGDGTAFSTVGARLSYAGASVLLYIDTLAPTNGFTSTQLQAFGQLFDQTLYPIDTAAFGPPSDIDQNGRVIMLMSPAVNALTSTADCVTQGYVAGFFEEEDLGGDANDGNSNHGEIFYSIVPDPNGTTSCAHTAGDVGASVPATFMHELQHLISFSQHAVVHGGAPEYGWLDEGMSIVAEELGSLYYEQKCPGTACRTDPAQLFPDSHRASSRVSSTIRIYTPCFQIRRA